MRTAGRNAEKGRKVCYGKAKMRKNPRFEKWSIYRPKFFDFGQKTGPVLRIRACFHFLTEITFRVIIDPKKRIKSLMI